ncbi:hypothetical protein GCM10010249_46890 [Streptomyces roseolilacinus]|uniref:Uncharacterized protein n=1 Tax=Streptomyces roseolilacinus TaxID=66904 RepID=A0A918ENW1_9ACTN|nr:hypothetical protein GCM10010249_46890 [Streptomyces roseolilacinus]
MSPQVASQSGQMRGAVVVGMGLPRFYGGHGSGPGRAYRPVRTLATVGAGPERTGPEQRAGPERAGPERAGLRDRSPAGPAPGPCTGAGEPPGPAPEPPGRRIRPTPAPARGARPATGAADSGGPPR